jgi:molybdopterin synthase catalytic subunit
MRAALTSTPIDASALTAEVSASAYGAVSLFIGTVRDQHDGRAVDGIEYNAYAPMAERELQRIASEASAQFQTTHIVIVHRTGYLALGEASVGIAVAHAHRAPALDATRWIIEELKRRVPIWKREHYTDGTREWVGQGAANGAGPLPEGPSRA